jgi:hypothetical protein
LAAGWLVFLVGVAVVMTAQTSAGIRFSPQAMRSAAATAIATAMVGVVVLWPMFRLSQRPPTGSIVRAMIGDVGVMLPPLVAVILPHALRFLAGWPVAVIGALCAHAAVWCILTAALLGWALADVRAGERRAGRVDGVRRGVWMAAFVVLAVGVPLGLVLAGDAGRSGPVPSGGAGSGDALRAASAVGGVFELTADRSASGASAAVPENLWRVLAGLGAGAAGVGLGSVAAAGLLGGRSVASAGPQGR